MGMQKRRRASFWGKLVIMSLRNPPLGVATITLGGKVINHHLRWWLLSERQKFKFFETPEKECLYNNKYYDKFA